MVKVEAIVALGVFTSAQAWEVQSVEACHGKQVLSATCSKAPCPPSCVPKDCLFGMWSAWGPADCTGSQARHRAVLVAGNECGMPCRGNSVEAKHALPPKTCKSDKDKSGPPLDCLMAEWSKWSECTSSCGGGQQTRDRRVQMPPSGGGMLCPAGGRTQIQPCNSQPCGDMPMPIDGMWSPWTKWGECTAKCGGGVQTRARKIPVQANKYGLPALGNHEEFKPCNTQKCPSSSEGKPIFCEWGEWKFYGHCSVSCGKGSVKRVRHLQSAARPLNLIEEQKNFVKDNEVLEGSHTRDIIISFGVGCLVSFIVMMVIMFALRTRTSGHISNAEAVPSDSGRPFCSIAEMEAASTVDVE